MMGDWVNGTRGMRADVKGVYIGLLIYQYDQGHVPSDLAELALIEPEVVKVWDKLKDKFKEIGGGKLQNEKLENVRAFWSKQKKNGKQGGRPPKDKPNINPKNNPKPNLQSDTDLDSDFELKKQNGVSRETEDAKLIRWEEYGNMIVDDLDQYWQNMRGRKVSREEMDSFLSVASRNSWEMDSQHSFRVALRGFDVKKGANGKEQPKLISTKNL